MTTPNTPVSTKPAPDMAVEARVDELMRAIDEVAELETDATLKADQSDKHNPDYVAADAKHVEARNNLKDDLRAALARPQEVAAPVSEKIAPVQGYTPGIPWSLHLEAYDAYRKRWSPQPALIDLEGRNCRGGFGVGELDEFIPGWRDRVSEIGQLKAEISRLTEALAAHPLQAQDAAPVGPILIDPEVLSALYRFNETCEDEQTYDVPLPMMKRMAEIGLVRRRTGSIYEITEIGQWALKTLADDAERIAFPKFSAGEVQGDAARLTDEQIQSIETQIEAERRDSWEYISKFARAIERAAIASQAGRGAS